MKSWVCDVFHQVLFVFAGRINLCCSLGTCFECHDCCCVLFVVSCGFLLQLLLCLGSNENLGEDE